MDITAIICYAWLGFWVVSGIFLFLAYLLGAIADDPWQIKHYKN